MQPLISLGSSSSEFTKKCSAGILLMIREATGELGRVAEELIFAVEQELKRYPGSIIPLLPTATLNLLKGLDLRAELENITQKHHADLAARSKEASLKDAATTFVGPMKLSLDVATKEMKALGASADTIAKGLANAGGIPVADINQAIHTAFPGAPSVQTPPVPYPFPTPPVPYNPFRH